MTQASFPGIVLGEDTWDKKPDSYTLAIERGRQGLAQGYANGLKRINNYLYGTHPGRYYLIGADSGVGKTTLADYMYLISLWLDCRKKGIPFRCKYFSFELSRNAKISRWISTFIKLLFNVELPGDYIDGRIPGMILSEDHFHLVRVAKQYVDEMLKDVDVIEAGVHPTWIFAQMIEMYEKLGKVHRKPSKDPKVKGFIEGYTPHDPRGVTMIFIDHLALAHEEKGVSGLKAVIDKISNNAVFLKNTFGTIIVFLQQFSTDLMSAHRANKKGDSMYTPQRVDFGDSKYTYRDADIVYGLVSPVMFDLETYKKYNIEGLRECFLACHLMKNRYGPASIMMPLFMNRLCGVVEELPAEPTNGIAIEPYYKQAQKLETTCQSFSPRNL